MALAIDSQLNAGNSSGTSWTFAYTNGSGSNRMVFVACFCPSAQTITGVTYAGIAMHQISTFLTSNGDNFRAYTFFLEGAASGANNVVISASASAAYLYAAVSSYTGYLGGATTDSSTSNNAVGTTLKTSSTTVADNCWLISGMFHDAGITTITPGTNTTNRISGNGIYLAIADTNAAQTPAGSKSMHWTVDTSTQIVALQASFSPTAPAPVVTSHPSLLMALM